MEMYPSRKLRTLLSFTFLLFFTGVLAQIQMPQRTMEVIEGQKVVLQAWYSPSSSTGKNTVLWNFVANNTQLIISYTPDSISFGSPQFGERVGFTATMPSANLSLYINNTQESDSGRYLCQVIIPGAQGLTGELSLNVNVPPAVPECSLSGKPVLKGNVTLSCKSKSGKPIPMYKWKKTSPPSEVFFSPMLNENTGTLKLSNLSSSMSGKYVCTASNTAGNDSCYINLEVITSTNAGMIAGATVGSVLGFIFIILFLVCLLRRRRDYEEDRANDIKEDAQAPKRISWAKSGGSGSDVVSKNGTLSSITTTANRPHQREPSSHHQHQPNHHLQHYPQRPPSDTASIITATGSVSGYRAGPRHGASTHGHALPDYGYNVATNLPRGQPANSAAPSANGSPMPRTKHPQHPQTYTQPQAAPPAPCPPPLPTIVTASNISRMGGVPIMVPAQNQAGSLV
ncbi:endothelial cell-selective adhesion molecule-like isoform X2 [Coregonus clupeaformis]|uniref:endothelial cell-selective adhesion molecule-like isoform X2 n=1 Tax=Coregonus clupeaformis TaxID=59861 RepID=UPI001BE0CCAF|nr:endothelial cell-selective adhesion molecule-like isoform X2 [Coregonus clupeaformis]